MVNVNNAQLHIYSKMYLLIGFARGKNGGKYLKEFFYKPSKPPIPTSDSHAFQM